MPSPRAATLIAALVAASLLVAVPAGAQETYTCRGHEATIVGTTGDDVIEGTDGPDVIVALAGDDIVFSGDGNDVVCTGPGDDVVFAGAGRDLVVTHAGDDFVYGGPGKDIMLGGKGDDVLEGGPGITRAKGNRGNDELWGTWCTPPGSMQHYCRWPDLSAPAGDTHPDLLGGSGLLRVGSVGDAVEQLQALLDTLGYQPGPADGIFGYLTAAAVMAFQADAGLTADGIVGPSTRAALADAAGTPDQAAGVPDLPADWVLGKVGTLRTGDRGVAVAALQQTLDDKGFDPGPVDGIYGSRTAAAVRAFQDDAGLRVDGAAGGTTKRALFGDFGDLKVTVGGADFDACNGATRKRTCESNRGLRSGAPWNAEAAEEWRPLITDVFTEWNLEDEIDRAIAIVACESLADPMITTPTGSGYYWIGLFQHTDRYWNARARRADIAGASPYDPEANATVAALLVSESIAAGSSRGPWAHWGCGNLLGYWDQ